MIEYLILNIKRNNTIRPKYNHQVCVSSGEVAAFSRSEPASIFNFSKDEVVTDFECDDGDEAVVDEDPLAFGHHLKGAKT
jgi:hypothetical protein